MEHIFLLSQNVHQVKTNTLKGTVKSFSTDDGDGSEENVTLKMNSRFFKLFRVYSNSLEMSKVGELPWS